jgi:hypothetical protein
VIRHVEHKRSMNTRKRKKLFSRHSPAVVLPSTADLDTYVRLAADEDRIRRLTSK